MYPVPAPDTAKQYQNYKEMADQCKNVSFVGRLANYKYFDMHQVVAQALAEFERLRRVL
jgi:UDP-galactopyranose mutase